MMKKLTAVLLVLFLMLPCAALAQVQMQRYELTDVGMTLETPVGWATATLDTADSCTLGEAFQMSGDAVRAMLISMNASFYAACDDYGITQMAVMSGEGAVGVDMRDHDLDMDAFMTGFLASYSNVKDSGVYQTEEATFVWVHYTEQEETGSAVDVIQYVTCVNSRAYVIHMMSFYGVELNEYPQELLKMVVDSIVFLD